ncbi:hypothetical protein [Leisingera sp. MMG026]|uniref:hypothetical protein n=1 Tax=Leisingera sp. MMG026 TaxID=2909982 RepID=UPI001F45E62C|nr:hypothetical protein [Leisingera sp. MMG026]MCF6433201.1 hypothetical protein [Leisingera sp. MMG026]
MQRACNRRLKPAGLISGKGSSFWSTPTYKQGGNRTSIRMGPGSFLFVADQNQTGGQVSLRTAGLCWTVMWDLMKATGWTPGPLASSPRCLVTLLAEDAHSKGAALLQQNPAFTDWMMGWPAGWTDPLQPVTGWSQWLQRARISN